MQSKKTTSNFGPRRNSINRFLHRRSTDLYRASAQEELWLRRFTLARRCGGSRGRRRDWRGGQPAGRSLAAGARPEGDLGWRGRWRRGDLGGEGVGLGISGEWEGSASWGWGGSAKMRGWRLARLGFSSRRVFSLLGILNFSNWEPYRGRCLPVRASERLQDFIVFRVNVN